jgi:hypothetical protein
MVMNSDETLVESPATGRKGSLFDGINVVLLAFIGFCFFMPFLEVSCGPINLAFSGLNLATGTDPTVDAPTAADREGVRRDFQKESKSITMQTVPSTAFWSQLNDTEAEHTSE